MTLNGLRRDHTMKVVEFARILNALSPEQLESLGVKDWNPKEAYDRVDRLFNLLCSSLSEGWTARVDDRSVTIDETFFTNRLLAASLVEVPAKSRSLAVDGTDVETWGALRGELDPDDVDALDDDGDALPDEGSPRRRRRRARVLGIGPDGRKIYTSDPDARAGHRSATNSRASGEYVGYEAHLGVQTRDVRWSDGIEGIKFGEDVPPVVTNFALTPAGYHRGDAIVPLLIAAKETGQGIDDVVWDRGYSQSRPETTSHPLNRAGIHQTFLPKGRQRDPRPFSDDAVLLEGQLFSAHVPEELHHTLPMPPMGATPEEVANSEKLFNRRARFRFQRHAGPDDDGVTRWRCPYHAGFLRSRSVPRTMRYSRTVPLEELPEGAACCSGTKSVAAVDLPLAQRLTVGTTAWRRSMGRRQVVETANGLLKGGFVNIERKFFRVLGLTKVTVLLAFTLVGYNLDRIRSFIASKAAEAAHLAGRRPRAKRRRGTWTDLLGPRNAAIGSAAASPQTAGGGPDPPPPT